MNDGCIIDSVGVGIDSLNSRKNKMENNLNVVDSSADKVKKRIDELLGLIDITRRYGMDYNDIAKDNNISDPNMIISGQEIIINVKNWKVVK